jgi:DNA-binding beta-propeller fold protein YncE
MRKYAPNFIPALVAGTALLASAAGPVPVTTIALGPQPPFGSAVQMAVNAGTNRIYVLNSTVSQLAPVAPSIAIIDIASSTRTGILQPVLPPGSNLVGASETRNAVKGFAVNPSNNKVYVAYASSTASTVVEIDSTTDTIAATAAVAGTIANIAVNPSTNKVYAIANGQLLVFDGSTLVQLTAIAGLENGALLVNPVNNKIYVGVTGAAFGVAVIDGSRDVTIAAVTLPSDVYDLALSPVSNNVYSKPNAPTAGSDLAVYEIDGSTNQLIASIASPAGITAGFGPNFDYIDGIHNTIYSGPVAIDGATNATRQGLPAFEFPLGATPPATCQSVQSPVVDFALGNMYGGCDGAIAVADVTTGTIRNLAAVNFVVVWAKLAVDPSSHAVYGISGGSVTIFNPVSLASTQAHMGDIAGGVAANPITNQVYITDESLSAAVILNGATNAITGETFAPVGGMIGAAFQPGGATSIAINKTKNQYIVAGGNGAIVFDGVSNAPLASVRPQLLAGNGLPAPVGFLFMSVNETTDKMYTTDNAHIFITDLATGIFQLFVSPQTKAGETCTVRGLTVNSAQNLVYASSVCQSASPVLFVFDGATAATVQVVDLGANIPLGSNVANVLYNPKSNKIYVANYGGFDVVTGTPNNPSTEVYNAVTFAHLASIPNVAGAMAVDTVLNTVYGLSDTQALSGDGVAGTVIDGNTDTLSSTIPLGFVISSLQPVPIAVNEATGMVYYVNSATGVISVFQGSLPNPGSFTVSGQLSGPAAAGITIAAKGSVTATTVTSAAGAYTIAGLTPGVYVVSPSAPGIFFSPLSQSVNITTANITGVNFGSLTSPIAITGMTLSPFNTIASGVTTTATVTLNEAAPAGGVSVTLSSTITKLIKIPATLTIPAGSTSASFTIQASGTNVVTPITLGATYQGSLALQPSFASVALTVSPGDTVHIKSATFSKSTQLITVTAASTNPQAVLQLFLASGNQLLGTFANLGSGNYSIQVPFNSGTPASINVKSNLGGSAGQGVTVTP